MAGTFRILGIDPGSQIAGFALIEAPRKNVYIPQDFRIIEAGALRAQAGQSLTERIGHMHETLFHMAKDWTPDICGIEKAFVGVNISSALKLGEARGALITAVRRSNVPVFEVTPTKVKKTITGQGHANKQQISLALKLLLRFKQGKLPFDVSDALAVALSLGLCFHEFSLNSAASRSKKGATLDHR